MTIPYNVENTQDVEILKKFFYSLQYKHEKSILKIKFTGYRNI